MCALGILFTVCTQLARLNPACADRHSHARAGPHHSGQQSPRGAHTSRLGLPGPLRGAGSDQGNGEEQTPGWRRRDGGRGRRRRETV